MKYAVGKGILMLNNFGHLSIFVPSLCNFWLFKFIFEYWTRPLPLASEELHPSNFVVDFCFRVNLHSCHTSNLSVHFSFLFIRLFPHSQINPALLFPWAFAPAALSVWNIICPILNHYLLVTFMGKSPQRVSDPPVLFPVLLQQIASSFNQPLFHFDLITS